VSTIVARLVADGVVREVGRGGSEAGGGRPAVLVEYAADRAFVAGLEIGVGRSRVMVADALGAPVVVRDIDLGAGRSARRPADQVLRRVVEVLLDELRPLGGAERLRAVGVSVTGLVQPATGLCLLAPNLGWRDVPVAGLAQELLGDGVPVIVRGAAQASLIAEHREGAARGEDDVVLIFEDDGVGAAVVEAGHLVEGVDGSAGELGHCAWPGAEGRCGCGRRGCVETVASGPAARRRAEAAGGRRLPRRRGLSTYASLAAVGDDPTVPEGVLEAVHASVAEAGRVLGTAASWLTAMTAPRLVVLSGTLPDAPRALHAELTRTLRARVLHDRPVEVRLGELGGDAALRGVVLLALDRCRELAPA
jgi:predicted NBD/HSP70 family sugar kinase